MACLPSPAHGNSTNHRRRAAAFSLILCSVLALTAPALHGASAVRIVSLSSPLTETIYTLGAQDHLTGVSDVCVFPPRVMQDRQSGKVRVVGGFMTPDLGIIESLNPDLVLTSTPLQRDLAQKLRDKGYQVLHFEPHSLTDVFAQMEQVGAAIGKAREAVRFTAGLRREVGEITEKSSALPRVKVYLEVNHEGPWSTGSVSPLNDIIRAAGGENIFGDQKNGVHQVANEEIIRRNPEVILSPIWVDAKLGGFDGIVTLASILARPGYDATHAVRSSRVLYYDSALMKHEGPRQVLAIRKLAYLLHPDVFKNPPETIPWELGRIIP